MFSSVTLETGGVSRVALSEVSPEGTMLSNSSLAVGPLDLFDELLLLDGELLLLDGVSKENNGVLRVT